MATSQDNWLLILQFEVYYKDTSIDDVALVNKCKEYPPKLVATFDLVTENRASWCELRLTFARFEMLITGCIMSSNGAIALALWVFLYLLV